LVERGGPCVALLWGRDAQSLTPRLGAMPVVASAHPSPLSASRGFFGSRPFSRVNTLLAEQDADPVKWSAIDLMRTPAAQVTPKDWNYL
jgi:uracil-DNA glycosylase